MQTYGFSHRRGEVGVEVVSSGFLVIVVNAVFQGLDRMFADKVSDVVQQCGGDETVRGIIGDCTGRALFHVL